MTKRAGPGERIDALTRHDRPIRFEGDILARAFAPRQNALPAPPVTISDAPYVCLIVNVQWVSHVLGVLETLNQPDAWTGDETERDRAQNEIRRLMEQLMIGDACMVDTCCPETNEILTEIKVLNQTIVNNMVTIINQNTTIIDNDTTLIEQNQTIEYNQYQTDYNNFVTNNQNISILNQMLYDGTPQSIYQNAGENFNSASDGILCAAIEAYINALIYVHAQQAAHAAQAAGVLASVVTLLAAAAAGLTAGASLALGIALNGAIYLSVQLWQSVLNDVQAQRKVRCCMFDYLKDKLLTEENFQVSVDDCGFDGNSNEGRLAAQIAHDNFNYPENWTAFLRALNQASGGSAENCNCDCGDDIELVPYSQLATQIIPMGNCVYRIIQNTVPDIDHPTWYRAGFKDLLDRPIRAENAPEPYVLQGIGGSTVVGACGDPDYNGDNFGGGFVPSNKMASVHWWSGEPVDTYMKITLVPPEECV